MPHMMTARKKPAMEQGNANSVKPQEQRIALLIVVQEGNNLKQCDKKKKHKRKMVDSFDLLRNETL